MKKILNIKILNFTSVILAIALYSCNSGDCTNGIQDGNETGIDCGGDCAACPTPPPPIGGNNNTGTPSNLPGNLIGKWELVQVYYESQSGNIFGLQNIQDTSKNVTFYQYIQTFPLNGYDHEYNYRTRINSITCYGGVNMNIRYMANVNNGILKFSYDNNSLPCEFFVETTNNDTLIVNRILEGDYLDDYNTGIQLGYNKWCHKFKRIQ